MITDFIINLFKTVIVGLINVLPSYPGLPEGLQNIIDTIKCYAEVLRAVIPLDTIYTIFAVSLAIETFIWIFKLTNWSINKARGSG